MIFLLLNFKTSNFAVNSICWQKFELTYFRGDVAVGQEELPALLRVAELLKVSY